MAGVLRPDRKRFTAHVGSFEDVLSRLKPGQFAIAAFLLLTVASLWERRTLPPAVLFLLMAAALARTKRRTDGKLL